jgi:hypothetical protein
MSPRAAVCAFDLACLETAGVVAEGEAPGPAFGPLSEHPTRAIATTTLVTTNVRITSSRFGNHT